GYQEYLRTMAVLLEALPEPGAKERPMEDLIPRRALGDANSIHQLQNYIAGPSSAGLVLGADGSLDWERSFRRIDYFALLRQVQVRNVPQPMLGREPVDFVAAAAGPDTVWLYGGPDSQALIRRRRDDDGTSSLRYEPVKSLTQSSEGTLQYDKQNWKAGLPLHLWESTLTGVDTSKRERWLREWHTEREWMRACYQVEYGIGLVSLMAHFTPAVHPGKHALVLDRFHEGERRSAMPDLLVVAREFWNFNVRSYNPGGNHGSFFRGASQATWVIGGGASTGIPRGLRISEPYDALSFVPTLRRLANLGDDASLAGPVVSELFEK
ncbi:MAG: hypothetical protein ABIZ80_03070, partial [Bryobacteraceae bacterium]